MKSKVKFLISVIAALVVGYAAGYLQASRSWGPSYTRFVYQRDAGDAAGFASALSYLRRGDQQQAMQQLEVLLDASLFGLGQMPASEHTQPILTSIRVARVYREQYPWQGSSPDIYQTVQRVLSLEK